MKTGMKRAVVVSAMVMLIAASLVTVGVTSAQTTDGDAGLPGYQGPPFVIALVRVMSTEGETSSNPLFNCAPFAVTGYVMSKWSGGVHVWISELNPTLEDLGYEVGDIITIFYPPEKLEKLNTGDWVQVVGITARGKLIWVKDQVLPQPFGY